MEKVKSLNINLHPDRLRDPTAADHLLSTLACTEGVVNLERSDGEDDGPYVNFHMQSSHVPSLWAALRDVIHRGGLSSSVIVTCQGDEGWNDYLLLHHFDANQVCDVVEDH